MLKNWQGRGLIDPERIGAFGFSMGGFTVLTAVGAQADLRIIPRHCAESPEFACEVLRNARSPFLKPGPSAGEFEPDPRIKAAVVAAPGFGFTMARTRPDAVQVPVQLWSADKDDSVPYATNAGLVRAALGSNVEFHAVPGAGHFSFLAPCSIIAPRLPVCAEQGDFDRSAFHESMNASVLAFFNRNLKSP
jgi:predicted dienelactone hydrolase